MTEKRLWAVVCPFCGLSYGQKVWSKILKSRLRGILGFGKRVPCHGHRTFFKADVFATNEAELDNGVGVGFFSQLKARLLAAIDNWLGNGWLDGADLQAALYRIGKRSGGYPVLSFGPGVAEGGCRRDVAVYAMGSEDLDVVRSDSKINAWG